jgi:nucleoside-diphosphate-sugar epimerase
VPQTVFLAGASGAIGRRLVPQMISAGHRVFGTTRSSDKLALVEQLGATAVIVDVFDSAKLVQVLRETHPTVVMNQLTDLPHALAGTLPAKVLQDNARLREEGTRRLVEAAISAGAQRMISQSVGWLYAPGPLPHREDDPLDLNPEGPSSVSVRGVIAHKN